MFGVIDEGKEASTQFYNQWVEQVKATVPKEKLLVFHVKEGWKPLCEFLDRPIPDQPFPRTNDSKEFQSNLKKGMVMSIFFIIILPVSIGLILYTKLY